MYRTRMRVVMMVVAGVAALALAGCSSKSSTKPTTTSTTAAKPTTTTAAKGKPVGAITCASLTNAQVQNLFGSGNVTGLGDKSGAGCQWFDPSGGKMLQLGTTTKYATAKAGGPGIEVQPVSGVGDEAFFTVQAPAKPGGESTITFYARRGGTDVVAIAILPTANEAAEKQMDQQAVEYLFSNQ